MKSLPPPFHRTLSTSIRMYNRLAFNGRRGRYLTVSLPTCRTAGQQVHGFDPMPCRGDDRNAGWNRSASVCKTAGVNRCTGLSLLPQLLLHTETRHVRVDVQDARCQQVHLAQPTAATLAAYCNPSGIILRRSARWQVSVGAPGSNYCRNSCRQLKPVSKSTPIYKTPGVNRCTWLELLPQLLLHTATRHVLFRVGLHDGRCQQVHTAQPTAATLAAYSNPSRMILRQSARRQVSTGAHGSNYRLNSYCIFQPVT